MDVTLACEGLQLKAHKMVLSACSPYFQAMLYNTPDRHPIVFLRDVRYEEMKALLEFMYRGEVSVDQENLSSLLKVAEGLKIKGLAEVNEHAPPPPTSVRPLVYPSSGGGLLSPQAAMEAALSSSSTTSSPLKRMSSPSGRTEAPAASSAAAATASSAAAATASGHYVGPRRKRAKPRRLSGSEAVPLASGLTEERSGSGEVKDQLLVHTGEASINAKIEKVRLKYVNKTCVS